MLSFSPLIAITKSLAWSNGRPTMLENCSLVNSVTSVSPEPTESMTFVPVWTRLAVRDTESRYAPHRPLASLVFKSIEVVDGFFELVSSLRRNVTCFLSLELTKARKGPLASQP